MKTNAGLRNMLDGLGCHAPIRFVRFPYAAEGLCIPGIGIFIDKKYQTTPEPYLQAVVYHEVGHWRDPVVWLSLLVIPVLLMLVYALAATGNPDFLLAIYGLLVAGYFVGIWKERRANAYARRRMPDYDVYDKPFVPGEK
jgi:hypothetical protein